MLRLNTIDAHAAGEPLRLIVDGFPSPRGKTMLAKREWVRTHADHLRRALMLEPRGHADMYGAILTEPVTPGSHAGVLFMHNEGYSTMCGHGVIAVTTIALERGLLMPGVTAARLFMTRRPARSAPEPGFGRTARELRDRQEQREGETQNGQPWRERLHGMARLQRKNSQRVSTASRFSTYPRSCST